MLYSSTAMGWHHQAVKLNQRDRYAGRLRSPHHILHLLEWYTGERVIFPFRLLKERTNYIGIIYILTFGGAFFTLLYYQPYYFQVVSGVSHQVSGVRNLSMIISVTLGTVASGAYITATVHSVPLIIGARMVSTLGTGLVFTLDIGSSSAKWIGY